MVNLRTNSFTKNIDRQNVGHIIKCPTTGDHIKLHVLKIGRFLNQNVGKNNFESNYMMKKYALISDALVHAGPDNMDVSDFYSLDSQSEI